LSGIIEAAIPAKNANVEVEGEERRRRVKPEQPSTVPLLYKRMEVAWCRSREPIEVSTGVNITDAYG
jgi:hypothetical protein